MSLPSERHDAFAEVFEELAPAVSYFFSRRGFPLEDCRDLTQETFLKAYRGLGRFRYDAEIKTWLLRIAANVWKNRLRDSRAVKRATRRTVSLEEIQSLAQPLARVVASGRGTNPQSPLDRAIRAERQRVVRDAVEELPPKMRRCVLLRLDQGLKYREIATLMTVSIETVKTQLHQARQRLKDGLSDHFSVSDGGE